MHLATTATNIINTNIQASKAYKTCLYLTGQLFKLFNAAGLGISL